MNILLPLSLLAHSLLLPGQYLQFVSLPTAQAAEYSTSTLPALVDFYAEYFGIPDQADEMLGTIKCESGGNPKAANVSKIESSHGLVQVNLRAHTDVSKAEAENPFYAVQWMAKEFSEHRQAEWTCWRKLYGNRSG